MDQEVWVRQPPKYATCGDTHKYPDSVKDNGPCWHCCQECEDILDNYLHDNAYSARAHYKSEKLAHNRRAHRTIATHEGNGTHKGAWAFTLTKSPTDDLTEEDMIKAVRKLMAQKSCPVEKYAWYLEHKDDNTHPHIHGMYQTTTGGKIETKHFKRAWPIWDPSTRMGAGFRGGYSRPVRSDEKYSAYIAKDGGLGDSSGL
jgi:hypothetical protein